MKKQFAFLAAILINYNAVHAGYEDALAYAKWTGKRFTSEQEWQYVAQASSEREWPWDTS